MNESKETAFVLAERSTGRILGQYTYVSFGEGPHQLPSEQYIRELHKDRLQGIADRDVEVVPIEPAEAPALRSATFLDLKTRCALARNRITLTANKQVMEGDGQDLAEIRIQITDDKDCPLKTFDGELQVETTRGRLSVRAGLLKVEKGHGVIRLISVPETVPQVWVKVTDPTGRCEAARLRFTFV